jgi:hypothetical protein
MDAGVLIAVFPMMLDFANYPLRPAHETITRFAATHDLAALDLLPSLAGRDVSELTIFLDGHPNARAHEIFADALFEKLTASAGTPPGRQSGRRDPGGRVDLS